MTQAFPRTKSQYLSKPYPNTVVFSRKRLGLPIDFICQLFALSSSRYQSSHPLSNEDEIYYSMSQYRATSTQATTPREIDLVYGFCLGDLYYRSADPSPSSSPATWENLDDTGFVVICSATDKSLWVAYNFNHITETDDVIEVQPEYGDSYGRLPGDTSDVVIGVQRIFGKEWTAKEPLGLGDVNPFDNDMGSGKAIEARLTASPVIVADVVKAIERSAAA